MNREEALAWMDRILNDPEPRRIYLEKQKEITAHLRNLYEAASLAEVWP